MTISDTQEFHNKKLDHFEEYFNEEDRTISLIMVFDDGSKLELKPYIDKDAKFDTNKNDLRFSYNKL
jgi:hypothetical protein